MEFVSVKHPRTTLIVTAYTGGTCVPSARFRVRQYIAPLAALGITIEERPGVLGAYPLPAKLLRAPWAVASLACRVFDLARGGKSDLTLLQREMLSTYCTLERFTPRPRLLDVDDAIWMPRRESFAQRLAGLCDAVICGNEFLAERFRHWNPVVHVLPTAVDTGRYQPPLNPPPREAPVIGWCGTSSGLKYLAGIEPALQRVLCRHPTARLRVVCDRMPVLHRIAPDRLEYVPWSAETEVVALQQMTVGLMPLDEQPWSLGKCAYKMLLYMACGVPAVVSPVGMNAEVLRLGGGALGAREITEWADILDWLLRNPDLAARMGHGGRQLVLRYYSLPVLAPRMAACLRSAVG